MTKRFGIIGITILMAAAIVAAPIVFAGAGHGGGHMRGHGGPGMGHGFGGPGMNFLGHLARVADELDLTSQQKDQIHAIFGELREQNAAYREQMHGGMQDVAKILIANPNDLATAQAKLDAQAAAERAMKANMLNAASKALNVLTPEQRTKLSSIMDEHMQRMQSRRK